jgi:hypothetical protein
VGPSDNSNGEETEEEEDEGEDEEEEEEEEEERDRRNNMLTYSERHTRNCGAGPGCPVWLNGVRPANDESCLRLLNGVHFCHSGIPHPPSTVSRA